MSNENQGYGSTLGFCILIMIISLIAGMFSGYLAGKQEGARQALQGKAHIVPMTNQTFNIIFDK